MDLFAGCGGLSLGLSQAGIKVQWANEFNNKAALTYKGIHSGLLFEEDAVVLYRRLLDGCKELPRKGDVELLAGGPPCQGFSGYNRHRRSNDPRNSLIEVFLDFVNHLQPPYVLFENVPGMLSLDKGRKVELLIEGFEQLGYQTRLGILQGGYYGLPQNRWRVFIWAAANSLPLPSFPEPTHQFSNTAIFGGKAFRKHVIKPLSNQENLFWHPKPKATVEDAISDLPLIENGGGCDEMDYTFKSKTDYQKISRRGAKLIYDHRCSHLGELMYERCKAIPKKPGAGWLDLPENLKPRNLVRHGDERYDNRFGRLHWGGTFNTILTRAYPYWGRVFHPEQDRVISVRESARAQGFPDIVRFSGPLSARYVQVGNAVPVTVARLLGEELKKVV